MLSAETLLVPPALKERDMQIREVCIWRLALQDLVVGSGSIARMVKRVA